jgi:hypothetical protein
MRGYDLKAVCDSLATMHQMVDTSAVGRALGRTMFRRMGEE